MSFEKAQPRAVFKPWGSYDLRPWNSIGNSAAIGELIFDRTGRRMPEPTLLLKLLFTKQNLSIQVHPDDAFARSMGMASGKTEAWYVLSAEDGAQVAIGLDRTMTRIELRNAIADGSIADFVKWRAAGVGDLFFIQAGTIHAIGAGLVIAEIQQRSDTTFRLFDQGRTRELHMDQALAVADLKPTKTEPVPVRLTAERMKLVSCPYFVFERIDLPPDANWVLQAGCETWALVIGGEATLGSMRACVGDVLFAERDKTIVKVGHDGVVLLLAYAASTPQSDLLRDLDGDAATRVGLDREKTAVLPLHSNEGCL